MEKTLKECLTEAADLIEQKGWIQGAFEQYKWEDNHHVPIAFCLAGAIRVVCPDRWCNNLEDRLEVCETLGFSNEEALYNWNDAKARRKFQVLKRLREAAAKLGDTK